MPDIDEGPFATLIELMELPGPTGQEEPVLSWCRQRWAGLGADVTSTQSATWLPISPVRGRGCSSRGMPTKSDFVVKSIDANGFVWLTDGRAGSRKTGQRFPVGQPALIVGREKRVPGCSLRPADTSCPPRRMLTAR